MTLGFTDPLDAMGKVNADIEVRVELEHELAAVRYSNDGYWQLVIWPPGLDVCYMGLADWPKVTAAAERVIAEHKRIQDVAEMMAAESLVKPNTNPRCSRCGHETYGAGQWCQNHGDQADYAPVYVSENRDRWAVEGERVYAERDDLEKRLRQLVAIEPLDNHMDCCDRLDGGALCEYGSASCVYCDGWPVFIPGRSCSPMVGFAHTVSCPWDAARSLLRDKDKAHQLGGGL